MVIFNLLLIGFLVVYLFQLVFSSAIERLNYNHLKQRGEKVAAVFEGYIDSEKLGQINDYTRENTRLSLVHRVISETILLGPPVANRVQPIS